VSLGPIPLDAIDSFAAVRAYPATAISPELITAVKNLDEREELEPFLRSIQGWKLLSAKVPDTLEGGRFCFY